MHCALIFSVQISYKQSLCGCFSGQCELASNPSEDVNFVRARFYCLHAVVKDLIEIGTSQER